MFTLEGIDHVALTVGDLEASITWYEEILGLEREHEETWGDTPAVLGVGETSVALFQADHKNGKPSPSADHIGFRHLAFRTDRPNFEQAQVAFKEQSIAFTFEDHDIAHSIYFNDPDGNEIEITTYEIPGTLEFGKRLASIHRPPPRPS